MAMKKKTNPTPEAKKKPAEKPVSLKPLKFEDAVKGLMRAKPHNSKGAAARAGVPWCTPHVLKHSAISWLAESGMTVDQISDFTGTHPATVRRVYRKFSPDYLDDVSAALSTKVFDGTHKSTRIHLVQG